MQEVARAAEETHPREAIDIYQRHAQRLVDQRGRDKYQEACRLLTRVRDLYTRLGEQETWARHVADLRERNRSLPAFKQELSAAGLWQG